MPRRPASLLVGGQGVRSDPESEGFEEKYRAVIDWGRPRMNRSAKDGIRSSPHYGGEGVTHSPIVRYGIVGCRRIRRNAGNGPDEPRQLTRDRGDHNLVQLALRREVTIALAQSGLRLPGDRAHRLWHCADGWQLVASDAGRETVAVCGLDQQGSSVNVAGLGDGADAALRAGGMFRWHQAEIGHEVGCGRKARRVTNGRR